MKEPLSVFELHRITYINNLMERIHERSNSLYEGLMDIEFDAARQDLQELMTILKDVEESLGEG
jgi:hypothetical protein